MARNLTDDLGSLIATALAALAATACCSGGPYEGDFGTCEAAEVELLPLVVVEGDVGDDQVYGDDASGGRCGGKGDDVLVCVEAGDGAPDCLAEDDLWDDAIDRGARHVSGKWKGDWTSATTCGPMELDERCCWVVSFTEQEEDSQNGSPGRPFLVRRAPRLASPVASDAWRTDEQPAQVHPGARAALVAHWARAGLAEHASVAAFARFALVLLHHGAPAELVADAHRAALDEVRHAQTCFGLASSYAGEPLGPGPLDVTGALVGELALERVVQTLVAEGCIGETLAALEAVEAARHAEDPVVRAALQGIAEDETRHAGLAWRTLAWLVEAHPHLRTVAAAALQRAEAVGDRPAGLARHGCLDAAAVERLRRVGWDGVIVPLAQQVVGQEAVTSSASSTPAIQPA